MSFAKTTKHVSFAPKTVFPSLLDFTSTDYVEISIEYSIVFNILVICSSAVVHCYIASSILTFPNKGLMILSIARDVRTVFKQSSLKSNTKTTFECSLYVLASCFVANPCNFLSFALSGTA